MCHTTSVSVFSKQAHNKRWPALFVSTMHLRSGSPGSPAGPREPYTGILVVFDLPEPSPDPINYVCLARVGNREARANLFRRRRRARDLHAAGFIGERTRSPPHLLYVLVLWQHRQTDCNRNVHALTVTTPALSGAGSRASACKQKRTPSIHCSALGG